jgi:hypothetical protein
VATKEAAATSAQTSEPSPPAASPAPSATPGRTNRTQPKADSVIPLVHAPDDPGPESTEEG